MVRKLLTGALFGAAALALSTQAFAQADVIEKRQKAMKSQSAAVKEIKAGVESKNYATVEAKAKDIMGTAEQIPGLFPKGSTTGKTKAKAEIWEKNDAFVKHAKALGKSAGELAAAAKDHNDAEMGVKLKAIGETCNSCHKEFRADKYSE
jgi:cytochrome c556